MKDCNCDLREGDAKTSVFGSNEMLHSPTAHPDFSSGDRGSRESESGIYQAS